MKRHPWLRYSRLPVGLLAVVLLAVGCAHRSPVASAPAPSPPPTRLSTPVVSATPPAAAPAQDFQPYTLISQPAPQPRAVTHKHRALHLTRHANRVYLADTNGRFYDVGRDTQGHLYPVYHDRETKAAYPLYYDTKRDRLYRVARADDGRFYRGYVDDPGDRYYASDRDYETITPSEQDRPVIEDSDYGSSRPGSRHYGQYAPYHSYPYQAPTPQAHQSNHHSNLNWLWAIPVIVGAYLLLHPHHHSSSPPYRYVPSGRPTAPATVVVRQNNPVTIINRINNTNSQTVRYSAHVAPPSAPAPRLVPVPLAAPRSARPLEPHIASQPVRPQLPAAHPLGATRPAPLPHPVVPRPQPRPATSHPAIPVPLPRPRPALVVHHTSVAPRPVLRPATVIHHPSVAPRLRVVRPIQVVHPVPVIARPRPPIQRPLVKVAPVIRRPAPVHVSHPAPRIPTVPRPITHPRTPVAAPRIPTVQHRPSPPVQRKAPVPHIVRRPEPPAPRPVVRPAPPVRHSPPVAEHHPMPAQQPRPKETPPSPPKSVPHPQQNRPAPPRPEAKPKSEEKPKSEDKGKPH